MCSSLEQKIKGGYSNGVARNFLLSFRHGKQIISFKLKVWILYAQLIFEVSNNGF